MIKATRKTKDETDKILDKILKDAEKETNRIIKWLADLDTIDKRNNGAGFEKGLAEWKAKNKPYEQLKDNPDIFLTNDF